MEILPTDAITASNNVASDLMVINNTAQQQQQQQQQHQITLIAKFGKERIVLSGLIPSMTIGEVKEELMLKTRILPKRQKLVGLVAKNGGTKGVTDTLLLSELQVKGGGKSSFDDGGVAAMDVITHQFILMGTPEEQIFVDPHERDDLPDVIDDFDLDFTAGSTEWLEHVAIGENLKKFTDHTEINIMNPPREGKPLLVLDLDHTLLDFSSKSLQRDNSTHEVGRGAAASMKRPYMDDFLSKCYQHYDLVVWSQTSWRWLETKLVELGMLANTGYRFCFVLDKTSMFTIKSTRRDGTSVTHHVKPLQIIWNKFPDRWGIHNTVHIDDLTRNFALNLESGLRIKPFHRNKGTSRRDVELLRLSRYLIELAEANVSFTDVDFDQWEDMTESGSLISSKESNSNNSSTG